MSGLVPAVVLRETVGGNSRPSLCRSELAREQHPLGGERSFREQARSYSISFFPSKALEEWRGSSALESRNSYLGQHAQEYRKCLAR